MTFPNFRNKHLYESMFTPQEFLEYYKKIGKLPKIPAPEGVILSYSKDLLDYIIKNHKTTKINAFYGEMYSLDETDGQIAILGKFGVGAPVVVIHLEELIAWGVGKFISIGTAGALQKKLKIGDLIVCDKAIRDEGTSYHYLKPSKYAHSSRELTERIINYLEKHKRKFYVGTSWTMDAPYRETISEAKKYQREGVLSVEMEASALFAVAKVRDAELAAIFTISDSLAELQWKPKFHLRRTSKGLEFLYKLAVDVLSEGK